MLEQDVVVPEDWQEGEIVGLRDRLLFKFHLDRFVEAEIEGRALRIRPKEDTDVEKLQKLLRIMVSANDALEITII